MSLFFLAQFTGVTAMRPYIVQVIKAYGSPISADRATVSIQNVIFVFINLTKSNEKFVSFQLILGFVGNVSNVICICFVKLLGKRKLYLIGLAGTFVSAIVLGKLMKLVFEYNKILKI